MSEPDAPSGFPIRIKLMDDSTFDVEVTPDTTLASLQDSILVHTGLPVARQRIIYRGKVLTAADSVASCRIQEGHTLHLVARPADLPPPSPIPTAAGAAAPSRAGAPSLRHLLSSVLGRRAAGSGPTAADSGEDAAATSPQPPDLPPLEHIAQSLATLDMVSRAAGLPLTASDSKTESGTERESKDDGGYDWCVGQWVDALDTTDQWLEATVLQIRGDEVLIHFNGWPSRWDEWILAASDRLLPFRTRSTPAVASQHVAPCIDRSDSSPLAASDASLGAYLPATLQAGTALLSLLDTFATAPQSVPGAQLAPLLDRFGRLLCDLAPLVQPPAGGGEGTEAGAGGSGDTPTQPLAAIVPVVNRPAGGAAQPRVDVYISAVLTPLHMGLPGGSMPPQLGLPAAAMPQAPTAGPTAARPASLSLPGTVPSPRTTMPWTSTLRPVPNNTSTDRPRSLLPQLMRGAPAAGQHAGPPAPWRQPSLPGMLLGGLPPTIMSSLRQQPPAPAPAPAPAPTATSPLTAPGLGMDASTLQSPLLPPPAALPELVVSPPSSGSPPGGVQRPVPPRRSPGRSTGLSPLTSSRRVSPSTEARPTSRGGATTPPTSFLNRFRRYFTRSSSPPPE